jgi:restriction system protein
MAVPGFQTFMLPLLKLTRDGGVKALADLEDSVAREFELGGDDLRERVPSGKQTKLHNRVSWCSTYLKKAKLLEAAGRGKVRITDLGRSVLAHPPAHINIGFLEQFEGFNDFKYAHKEADAPVVVVDEAGDAAETPEETLERSYLALRKQLAAELLERVKQSPPRFFEELVVDLLVTMGYGGSRKDAGEAVGQSGDGGIDGIIKEDRLGLDALYIQAKRWENAVGRSCRRSREAWKVTGRARASSSPRPTSRPTRASTSERSRRRSC